MNMHDAHWDLPERTECSCKVCKLNCRVMPAMLLPEDLVPLMGETGFIEIEEFGEDKDKVVSLSPSEVMEWASECLSASDGALIRFPDECPLRGYGNTMRVPTLVPRSRKNNCCIFYDKKSGMCDVHANSPFGCRMFDCKTPAEDGDKLSTAAAVRLAYMWDTCHHGDVDELDMIESMYCSIWLSLYSNGGRRKKTTEQLRRKLKIEVEKMKRGKE